MFNMMVVDDETIIRQGIKTSIDWSSYGINIIAEAENGQEAKEIVLDLQPDILITDIRMPVLDGLELAEVIREKQLKTRVIILSGYDDFEYAKKSISLNVADYLLKPFGAEELIDVVVKLKDKIVKERQERESLLYNKMLMQENMRLIQSRFIKNLLTKEYTDYTYILDKADALNIDLIGPYYQIHLIDIDDFYLISENISLNEKELLINSVINLASSTLKNYYKGSICKSDSNYLILLVNLPKKAQSTVQLNKEIQNIIRKKLNLSITIGMGEIYSDISTISVSYKEALLALRQKVYRGKGSIINYKELQEHEKDKHIFYPNTKEKVFLNELRFLNKKNIMDILDKLFEKFTNEKTDYTNIKNITLRLVLMAQGLLEEKGIDIEEELQKKFKPYNDIEKYETIQDIKIWLKDLFLDFIEIIKKNKSKKYTKIINKALQYIKENYASDISLNDIASIVYVTPNYFSKIFKEETGENFTTWLNKYRIEQAKCIIENDKQVKFYQVSEMVGFNDYKYFSTIFKKTTSMTPSEYKQKI